MAIAIATSLALKRIVDALCLGDCRSLSLSAEVGSVVTVTAERYVTESQLEALATALETREYVLVPKAEWLEMRMALSRRRQSD